MMDNIYSFDVFDTCLCRLCGAPHLLFDVLSRKVQKAMGNGCNEHIRQSFVIARLKACGNDLVEIYNQVVKTFPIPFAVDRMAELELETEREMLVPILATLKLVNELRAKGKVLFISDMYLPSSFIKERLEAFGFFKEGDRLYVSDELQAWKYDGSLYRLVHEREGGDYRHWHHYGDNRVSDFEVPRKMGIKAHYLNYDYLPYEEEWKQSPVLGYQYSAILAGVARAIRLSSEASEDQKAFVCDISAPLMVSWMLNVLEDAQSRGIKRLYFCARDVHTEYLIARWLKKFYVGVEVRYLFISMQALKADEEVLCSYLVQEGILSTDSVALVDSNSSGNTLIRINAIARKRHLHSVQGYYFTGWTPSGNMLFPTLEDLQSLHYINSPGYTCCVASSQIRKLSGMRILYELILSINYHKRTVGYESHGSVIRPVLEADSEDNWYIEGADVRLTKRNNDNMALAFARSLDATELFCFSRDIMLQLVVPTLAGFVDRPNKSYLHYLNRFVLWDQPFVGSIRGKHKGKWNRGSVFYRLPSFLSYPLRAILSNSDMRRRLNQMLAWKRKK